MKAVLAFSLFAVANGVVTTVLNCGIPAQYATSAAGVCTGASAGYDLFGVCLNGLDAATFASQATLGGIPVRIPMTATNAGAAFTSGNLAVGPLASPLGCVVPSAAFSWTSNGANPIPGLATEFATKGALASSTTSQCAPPGGIGVAVPLQGAATPSQFLAGVPGQPFSLTNTFWKGIEIKCAANFFPVNGYQGTNICMPGVGAVDSAGTKLWQDRTVPPATNLNAYWSSNPFQAYDGTTAQFQNAATTQFDATNGNNLQCASACTIPATLCNAATGLFYPNVVTMPGSALVGGCLMRPSHPEWISRATFACGTGGKLGPQWVARCNANAAPAVTSTAIFESAAYAGECGGLNGGSTRVMFAEYTTSARRQDMSTTTSNLAFSKFFPKGASDAKQMAGEISSPFGAVTSVLTLAYRATSAQSAIRGWNDNPNQVFQTGGAFNIAVAGCTQATQAEMSMCIQHTLNWWRCKYDIDWRGGRCYANGINVPCPFYELGFRCNDDSKKGLLGLLGLIAVPVLLLLCCIPLLFCCLRRKKTESDVHFATFDPLGAPATACPTAFGGYAPSAVPML